MNITKLLVYIIVTAVSTYLIRMIPLVAIQKKIQNRFFRSFLYYVPYVTLAVMTFPSILSATNSVVSAFMALVIGIGLAWFGANLLQVSVCACLVVFILELFIC